MESGQRRKNHDLCGLKPKENIDGRVAGHPRRVGCGVEARWEPAAVLRLLVWFRDPHRFLVERQVAVRVGRVLRSKAGEVE